MSNIIREPAVAGQFYPADRDELLDMTRGFLTKAPGKKRKIPLRVLMVPHAGYMFSGPTAACGYKELEGEEVGNVFLLGDSHSSFFNGISLDGSDKWRTPLGEVDVNTDIVRRIAERITEAEINDEAHMNEHSLEAQLPFLQMVLKKGFNIVPLLFGDAEDDLSKEVADVIVELMDDNDIVVVSTDMSHYPASEDAKRIDKRTLELIIKMDAAGLKKHISETEEENIPGEDTLICGLNSVLTMISLARGSGLTEGEVLDYSISSDSGLTDKQSVVGYSCIVFGAGKKGDEKFTPGAQEGELSREDGKELLDIARRAVESRVKGCKVPDIDVKSPILNDMRGVFVTIKKNGELRGCIGQIVPSKDPLWKVTEDMAQEAAFNDGRFPPVEEGELPELSYEVSVLSPPRPVRDWQEVEEGRHGVIIRCEGRSGVFLPQVAEETGWDREEFLSQLCFQKLGLPPKCFKDPKAEIFTFTAQVFKE